MADKRIDQLNTNSNPLTGQELIPIFDKSTNNTEKISIDTLVSYIDLNDDTITGGTYNNITNTLTLRKNGGTSFNITGFTNFYTTGATLNNDVLQFNRNDLNNAYSVDLSSLKFSGNTSGDCISDIFVSNIHSCSPLRINPNDEGDIIFGSNGNITIDVSNGIVSASTFTGFGTINYKSFVANYDVSSDTLITFENNLGSVLFSYDSLNNYVEISSQSLFTLNKTFVMVTPNNIISGSSLSTIYNPSFNDSNILVSDGTNITDSMNSYSLKFNIEIRVYN